MDKIWYGGDYNPEQWEEATWKEDMRLFKLAGIDCVTLNVFSWALLQRDENTYCFDQLDRIMKLVKENGLKVILATSTAAHPAWMARKYPEVTRVDFNGWKRKFGDRHNSCPNSPVYQKYSVRLAQKLAERYGNYENLVAWHVNNEYSGACYCENCEKAFRKWLQKKYGTLEKVNRAWNTSFWSHTFYDWDEIVLPNRASEQVSEDCTAFQGISLDYRRFNSDSMLANFQAEYEAIKAVTPDIPVTTNMMGFYKGLDYQKWGRAVDVAAWDNYPWDGDSPAMVAMRHDLFRGLKQGAPFLLMEQTPSVMNWQPYNLMKRPGELRMQSYQAVAHGADAVLFFQMRRSRGACEKFHGAVIDHAGGEHTRVFSEVRELGKELKRLGDRTTGARTASEIAILLDWDNWWALEYSAGPNNDLNYLDEAIRYYTALYKKNVSVDLISVEDKLDDYKLVIAPLLYMVKEGTDEKIRQFVKNGGTFVTTYLSGMVDESDLVTTEGYPGKLRDILGIWVEERDALPPDRKNHFVWEGKSYEAGTICDIFHPETARTLACYQEDFYAGMPVMSENRYGKGKAYYIATRSESSFYEDLMQMLLEEQKIQPLFPPYEGLEVTVRQKEGKRYLFLINHKTAPLSVRIEKAGVELLTGREKVPGETEELPPYGVAILEEKMGGETV